MVGCMARRVDTLYSPVCASDNVAVCYKMVWHEVHVAALFHLHTLFNFAGAVRAIGVSRCAGSGLQRAASRRMVHVGMGDQNMTDFLAGQPGQNRVNMRLIIGAGVDYRNLAGA